MSDFLRSMVTEKMTLARVCLLVRKAGLEHLVSGVDPEELECLAAAHDVMLLELVAAILDPAKAAAPFDGGRALWRRKLSVIMAEGAPAGG